MGAKAKIATVGVVRQGEVPVVDDEEETVEGVEFGGGCGGLKRDSDRTRRDVDVAGIYDDLERWISYWYQIRLRPSRVLEVGPGSGVFRSYLQNAGVEALSLDIDETRKPDFVADLPNLDSALPADERFDIVCAFQVLDYSARRITKIMSRHFEVEDRYFVKENLYHYLWVLRSRGSGANAQNCTHPRCWRGDGKVAGSATIHRSTSPMPALLFELRKRYVGERAG